MVLAYRGTIMTFDNKLLSQRAAFGVRLGVGLGFGLVMAWLMSGAAKPGFNEVHSALPHWKSSLYSALFLSAFIWWAGAGTMRRGSLVIWGFLATALVAILALFQLDDGNSTPGYAFFSRNGMLIVPLLFIGHELVSSGDHSKQWLAPYPTYFDQAWKRGVQLVLALLFTGLFWGILWLGATLLNFIGFHWLRDLLQIDWFGLPATGVAMACAVQLGDVQDKLLTNVRALVLSVLSWLLPVIAAIGVLFLASLCASGLEPLWKTKAASVTLLGACIAFVLLINAAYQQGDAERSVHVVMKWAARLGCGLLLIFAALAAYSLWLRVGQYGLTTERVMAGAGVIIALLFGLGYTVAAALPGRWLAALERVNIAMAFVEILIFLGLLTPVADPARLGAADQVARLHAKHVQLDQFDWEQLRFQTGRYGRDALKALAKSSPDAKIRAKATAVLAEDAASTLKTLPADDMARLKVVSPAAGALPTTFDGKALETGGLRECVREVGFDCTAALVDLNGDGVAEVAVRNGNDVTIFRHQADGWRPVAMAAQYLNDDGVKAFDAGQVTTKPHTWSDLDVGGTRLIVNADK